jgi:hypothetical protein
MIWQQQYRERQRKAPLSETTKDVLRQNAEARAESRRQKMVSADYNHRNKDGNLDEWDGVTIHFVIHALSAKTYEVEQHDGYLITRQNQDGTLYAIRVRMGKAGGAEEWVDQWAKQFTKNIRTTPLLDLLKEGMHQQFEPSGATNIQGIARCGSPVDLICKIIMKKYLPAEWAEYNKGKTDGGGVK